MSDSSDMTGARGVSGSALPDDADKQRFVEHMFDGIAPRYDLMNRMMTFGLDRSWRRAAVAELGIGSGDLVVDLGCGTGDLCADAATTGADVVGVDLSSAMLARAAARLPGCGFVRADAAALPLADGACAAAVSGFALRNFASVPGVLEEVARVVRPGAVLAVLEVDVPRSAPLRAAFGVYFGRVVPALGRLVSDGYAYEYLAGSLVYLPSHEEFARMLAAAGFGAVRKRRFAGGAAQLVTARRTQEGSR